MKWHAAPRLLSLAGTILLLGSNASNAIATYVAPYVAQHDFSGVIYVARPGGDGYRGAFGEGISFQTAFAIGSISKTFTAAAIELLASQGKLQYADSLAKYVPEYKYGSDVTIEELLAHSAGIPDFYSIRAFASVRERNLSLTQVVQWLNAYPLDFKPGTKSRYSNSGYTLLALVVERASGESYEGFLTDRIFKPLGLKHTFASDSRASVAAGNDPGPPPTYLVPAAPIGAGWFVGNGSIRSNAADLAHWLDVAAEGKFANFGSLAYPYGWSKQPDDVLEQDGRIAGYAADISIDEKSGFQDHSPQQHSMRGGIHDRHSAAQSTKGGTTNLTHATARLRPRSLRTSVRRGKLRIPGSPARCLRQKWRDVPHERQRRDAARARSCGPRRISLSPAVRLAAFQDRCEGCSAINRLGRPTYYPARGTSGVTALIAS